MRQTARKVDSDRKTSRVSAGATSPAAGQLNRLLQTAHRDRFVVAVEAIYDAALDPARWPDALHTIADVLGDVGAILLWRRDDGAFGSIASPSVVEAQKEFEQDGWMIHDLRALRAAERGYFFSGEPFTDRHVCTDEEIRTNPSYTQFQARYGLGWFGAVAVSPNPHVGVVLSVHRAKSRPPISDAELGIVAELGRHVEKSLRLSIRLFDADLLNLGLGEALTRLGIGVFALDSSRRVIFVNPAGARLLGDDLMVVKDRLLASAMPGRALLENAIQQTCRFTPAAIVADQKPILIEREEEERPLVVYVLPTGPSSQPAAEFLAHARAIVLAIDPDANDPADPALVRDVLGLTLGEARMAALVGSGLGVREASQRLRITEETARSVLKHVFCKTGVSRQSELVVLLSKMVLHKNGQNSSCHAAQEQGST
jgi:DNA-binding CsgD family transcriptional regulator/PAS domain-containing protein